MTEQTITKTQIIVVNEVGTNIYGDLTFTDKAGGSYKVSNKRKSYFGKVILSGAAVQLNYAMSSFGKEYIYSAVQVKDQLSPPVIPSQVKLSNVEQSSSKKMSKEDWAEKDRITRKSVERQKALELAKDWAVALLNSSSFTKKDVLSAMSIIEIANVFELKYLDSGKEVQSAKNTAVAKDLVSEILDLGAEVIDEGGK